MPLLNTYIQMSKLILIFFSKKHRHISNISLTYDPSLKKIYQELQEELITQPLNPTVQKKKTMFKRM